MKPVPKLTIQKAVQEPKSLFKKNQLKPNHNFKPIL